jgi:hypothetical protein
MERPFFICSVLIAAWRRHLRLRVACVLLVAACMAQRLCTGLRPIA